MLKHRIIRFFLFLLLLISCNASADNNTHLIPYKSGSLYGFLDESLLVVIPAQFDRIEPFLNRQYSAVRWNSKRSGIINTLGETIFETNSPQIRQIYKNLFVFDTENGKAIYDINKKSIIIDGLNRIYSSENGIIAVSYISPLRSTYITAEGIDLFPDRNYRRTFPYSNGAAVVIENNHFSYLIDEMAIISLYQNLVIPV